MLKAWHKEDIWAVLRTRGWGDPVAVPASDYTVGEAYDIGRPDKKLTLLFVADAGRGFTDSKSIEEVVVHGRSTDRLWLHRRRDAKWRAALSNWADAVSDLSARGA